MNYRINTYNENYIMINHYETFALQTKIMDKEKTSLEDIRAEAEMDKLINYMLHYRNKKGKLTIIEEIAIHRNSKLGKYIIELEENSRENISFSEIVNALLACIEKEEWEYYEELTNLIKVFKSQNCSKHDYMNFRLFKGNEITNYIINNSHRKPIIYNNRNDKHIYLYENNEIVSIEISSQEQTKPKTRTKTK